MKVPASLVKLFHQHQSFLAHIHLSPDADSIGAALGLKMGLETLGNLVTVFCEDPLPAFADFLPATAIAPSSLSDQLASTPFSAYVALDTAKWSMATRRQPLPDITTPIINIDHHPDNQLDTPHTWLEPSASSASEQVFYLLTALEVKLTPDIATCLLFGLLGDTGILSNFNTSTSALRVAALLHNKGAQYNHCLVALSRSYSFPILQAWSVLLAHTHTSPDGRYVWTAINHDLYQKHQPHIKPSLFANQVISRVDGTDFGAVFVEKEPRLTHASFRSRRPEVDVSQIARALGGGGHVNAAGLRIERSLETVLTDFHHTVAYLQKQGQL